MPSGSIWSGRAADHHQSPRIGSHHVLDPGREVVGRRGPVGPRCRWHDPCGAARCHGRVEPLAHSGRAEGLQGFPDMWRIDLRPGRGYFTGWARDDLGGRALGGLHATCLPERSWATHPDPARAAAGNTPAQSQCKKKRRKERPGPAAYQVEGGRSGGDAKQVLRLGRHVREARQEGPGR